MSTDELSKEALGQRFPIVVVAYDPAWVDAYEEEARRLQERFGLDIINRTEHFGSTAVPGLAAKPVVDILVEVPSFAVVRERIIPVLEGKGYHAIWRDDRPPGHMMIVKGYDIIEGYVEGEQTYHLHLAPAGHPVWDRLTFRDALRSDPVLAREYEALKRELAERHRNDRDAYTNAKTKFIKRATERARKQAEESRTRARPPHQPQKD